MKKYSSKLVRDKIPEILQKQKIFYSEKKLPPGQFNKALAKKLVEEALEYSESEKSEELADVLEVLLAILKYKKWSWSRLQILRKRKLKARGGFEKRISIRIHDGPKRGSK